MSEESSAKSRRDAALRAVLEVAGPQVCDAFHAALATYATTERTLLLTEILGDEPEVAPGASAELIRGFALFDHAVKQAAAWRLQVESAAREREEAVRVAYADARERAVTAFLSVIAGGFSEHVVMWNYEKLRDYLNGKSLGR